MNKQIRIRNNQESTIIDIEGTIGVPEQWQFDDPQQRVATYESFRRTIQQIEELQSTSVVVNIRSTGGDVGDAILIYDALVGLDAEVTTRCWGYVASAATVIAQAASEGRREISSNALYLIHNSTCAAEGNAIELEQRVELLKKSDERLADIYARRSGRDAEQFVELMGEESGQGRWLNAEEAIEAGLADMVVETTRLESVAESVNETVQEALDSVKGVIKRIGAKLRGEEQEESEASEAAPARVSTLDVGVSDTSVGDNTSQIVFEQRQQELRPTQLEMCEDPSLREATMSANESAYRHDARSLRR